MRKVMRGNFTLEIKIWWPFFNAHDFYSLQYLKGVCCTLFSTCLPFILVRWVRVLTYMESCNSRSVSNFFFKCVVISLEFLMKRLLCRRLDALCIPDKTVSAPEHWRFCWILWENTQRANLFSIIFMCCGPARVQNTWVTLVCRIHFGQNRLFVTCLFIFLLFAGRTTNYRSSTYLFA